MDKSQIRIVQKQRGRGSNCLRLVLNDGKEMSVPMDERNRHYRAILDWSADGNKILDPDPKSVEPGRGSRAYREHPNFHLPEDDSSAIWRYMPDWKFRDLIKSEKLYFRRGDLLRKEDDKEGTLPKQNLSIDPAKLAELGYGPNHEIKDPEKWAKQHRDLGESLGRTYFINCWNMAENESEKMREKFGNGPKSVAVRSTLSKLKQCFGNYVDYDIFIGQISYKDYDTEELDEGNYFNLFLHKHGPKFEHEREIRCLLRDDGDISLISNDEPFDPFDMFDTDWSKLSEGISVQVNLEALFGEVILAPDAPSDYLDEITKAIEEKGIPAALVKCSELDR